MLPLVEQAESQLRDVCDHGIQSIEKSMVIAKLLTKLDGIETEEVIISKIESLIQKHGRDIEALNVDTDLVIYGLLEQLGYKKLVSLLKSLPSWS